MGLSRKKSVKRLIAVFCLLTVCCFVAGQAPVASAQSISITAPSALVIEADSGRVLYSKSPNVKRAPASTVKLLTALVVLDRMRLDQWVTMPNSVTSVQPRILRVQPGEKIRVRDLLKALLMNSANDVAHALAVTVSGSDWGFGRLMTEKARQLGAQNSNFVFASGLPAEGQYSTVSDLAIIMDAARKNSFIAGVLRRQTDSITTNEGRRYYLKSHNKMLLRGENMIGKTGWTRKAGYCFVGYGKGARNQNVIVSVLGSRRLWNDVELLVRGASRTPTKKGYLFKGVRGPEVVRVQNALKKAGYFKANSTGYFGEITERALKKFQKAKGLKVDGIYGDRSRAALSRYM